VCSIGNVPLAAVLWNGGISFGGVIAFIFGDLIILPILNIYRRYYGLRTAAFLFGTFYATMVAAGLAIEFLFDGLGLIPTHRHANQHAIGHAAADLAESVKCPGFRKGKVPMQVLIARVGKDRVYSEAVESHIGGWFRNAVAGSRIRPVSRPEYEYELPSSADA